MPSTLFRLRALLTELRRRSVVQVVIGYVVAAAFIIQLVEMVGPTLGLPDRALDFTVIASLIGLPIAALLAWVYDLVPDPGTADASQVAEPEPSGRAPLPVLIREPLPAAGTPFVGRVQELRELVALLEDGPTRLITVLGTGGAGKTRLAVRAAEEAAPGFSHGVAYVPLSSLAGADLLPQALAESVGVSLARRDDPLDELSNFLREKQLLLLLDNFDDLTGESTLLTTLLERAPGLKLLVTSQERLNLMQETVLPLEGLMVGGTAPEQSEAVQLFISAARRHDPRLELDPDALRAVERICTLVGGMPLAIELAAASVRVLSCSEICTELEQDIDILSSSAPDLPVRHRSIRATFEGSWRLLSVAEQEAAARLSVLRTAFDRHAALAVAEADVPLLRMLLDKSLLRRSSGRFMMLEMIRHFSAERLREQGDEYATRERHLAHFSALLLQERSDAVRWHKPALDRIAETIHEVRAAWSFAVEISAAAALDRSLDALFHFYEARGWAREGADAFGRATASLSAASSSADPGVRLLLARLDVRQGALCDRLGRAADAERLLRRGLAGARETGHVPEIVFALQKLGAHRLGAGMQDDAERLQREAFDLAAGLADEHALAWCQIHLGNVAWARGDYDGAAKLCDDALLRLRMEDDRNGMWAALNNLGVIAAMRHQHEQARARFEEGLALQAELGNRRSIATLLHNLGSAAADAGDYAEALSHLEEGLSISEEMGYQGMIAHSLATLADVLLRAEKLTASEQAIHRALRMATAAHNYPASLAALLTLARLRCQRDDRVGAAAIASLIAAHPANDEDGRRQAAQLLNELQAGEPGCHDDADLDRMIEDVLRDGPPVTA